MTAVRFDDLTPGAERAFALRGLTGTVEARRPADVPAAIEAVEEAAARGLWAAGFVAYEAAPGLNPDLRVRDPAPRFERDLPLVWFGTFERRDELDPLGAGPPDPKRSDPIWEPSVDRSRYDDAIQRIRELIAAGDVYQVNHTLRLRARLEEDPDELYRHLCLAQRGRYSAFLDLGRHLVLSASPELFLRIEGDRIAVRPMKGTAPRGRWAAEDRQVARDLLASSKDRAENAMIVDLLRNDLGRVARPGSVEVARLFELERYETVWQLTSTIAARLRPRLRLLDVLRALFPSGSVTGAPKVAAMRVIAELEDSPRGVYTGAIGYVAPDHEPGPRACFSVAIRTVVVDAATGTAEYGVGGGITYDSCPRREYDEVLAKARVLSARRPEFELVETLGHDPDTGYADLDEHLERLAASAAYFGFRHDPSAVAEALDRAARALVGPARVRLALARSGEVRTDTGPMPPAPEAPLRVAIDPEPVDPADVW
ncbi:MAG TPA: aminodeoxychorismate synthase component I, partial [Actinomycetota bacterium]|nr:aminodeoxychorismate synthase component I [Actinomycetota bacterium]